MSIKKSSLKSVHLFPFLVQSRNFKIAFLGQCKNHQSKNQWKSFDISAHWEVKRRRRGVSVRENLTDLKHSSHCDLIVSSIYSIRSFTYTCANTTKIHIVEIFCHFQFNFQRMTVIQIYSTIDKNFEVLDLSKLENIV